MTESVHRLIIDVAEISDVTMYESITIDAADSCPFNHLLLVPLPRRLDVSELDQNLHNLNWDSDVDAVVLITHACDVSTIMGDAQARENVHHRLAARPIWLLNYPVTATLRQARYQLMSLSSPPEVDVTSLEQWLIEACRTAHLWALTHKAGSLLGQNDLYHYEGPNGRHYPAFLRVGTTLQSMDVLNSFAFWLLPYMRGKSLVVMDSGSILPIGLQGVRYLRETGYVRRDTLTTIECLRSYDESLDDLVRRARQSLGPPGRRRPKALLLSSVTSTGSLRRQMEEALTTRLGANVQSVSLYGSPEAAKVQTVTLCTLGEEFVSQPDADCSMCREKSTPIAIDRMSYLQQVSAHAETVAIREVDATECRAFFERYNGRGCVRIHRSQAASPRHHMLDIDIEPLLTFDPFAQRIRESVGILRQGTDRIDLVLTPSHAAAKKLGAIVAGQLGLGEQGLIHRDEDELTDAPSDELERLQAAERILIVDDVMITGSRLRGYRHFLLRAGCISADTQLFAWVGVARPPNAEKLQGVGDFVGHRPSFRAFGSADQVFLPNWGTRECPWCWELDQLRRHSWSLEESDALRERFETLQEVGQGIQSGLFLPWASGGARPLRLGPNSIFGLIGEPELFATVAATLQVLRNRGDLTERFSTPIARVLKPEKTVDGRFYDDLIGASILRAARVHDFRSPQTDEPLLSFTSEWIDHAASEPLRSEILFAASRKLLPRPSSINLGNHAVFAGDRGICSFLRRLLGETAPKP